MTKVSLVQENVGADEPAFRALTVCNQAAGRTAGEALDALTAQLRDRPLGPPGGDQRCTG